MCVCVCDHEKINIIVTVLMLKWADVAVIYCQIGEKQSPTPLNAFHIE